METVIKPAVGIGCTMAAGSDRYPWTIHAIISDKAFFASQDSYKRIDENGPYSEAQEYSYSNDDQKRPQNWIKFTLRNDGRWHEGTRKSGAVLYVGSRRAYLDPCF